ncbi:MAG: PBP1A family penicillin-binding protein [Woronichinia naegeliana WA131]|jgi:1A family penicillin-binding protein|uniref:PBP1A family penicillin-binding protein n=1 Tax=Woronichinia naegeliana WA131 TaxID=2824559 RepID=A0A977KVD4_9CYAN|nr:MAG: PBP1A family penicillin-binding protein [Woronichinia naegeliana WA131]
MTQPYSQQPLSQLVTQAIQRLARHSSKVAIKKGARVAKLLIKDTPQAKTRDYPLLGDRYIIGRSSRTCDILIENPIVSQTHCSLHRSSQNPNQFEIRDEDSTNGIYLGRKRLQSLVLKSGDVISLGPPELENVTEITFHNPAPVWLKSLRYGLYGTGLLTGLAALGIFWASSGIQVKPLPPGVVGPVVIYANDGKTPLNPVKQETHHELRQLKEFSPYLAKAVIASEDSRFYWHFGVDPYGVLRAILINSKGRMQQGASTLTQQLARSLFPEVGRENTAMRKLREMVVALKLEAVYSKDDILKAYLNRVYLGAGNYGFEDASQFYFDKSAKNLTISEAATLVAMLPAPNLYNPVQDYDTSVQFRDRVIKRMVSQGMISEQEGNRARRSRIEVSPKARQSLSKLIAPYFYSYVFSELQQLLGEEIAKEGNFIVESGLDIKTQKKAEQALKQNIATKGSQFHYSQGALVTLNSNNGEIVALVGGANYQKSQYNRVTQAKRQPGSTFKLFTYTAALEQGISASSIFSCKALFWQGQAFKGCERSQGEITMTHGLAQSENAVALRVAQRVGLDNIVNLAERLGIRSTLNASPGLVLGQSETTVLEMTGAYGAIANQGRWNKPHAIRRILDGGDCQNYDQPQTCRLIYEFNPDQDGQRQVIPQNIANTMAGMLRNAVTSGTGRSANTVAGAAGKTGTTNKGVDLWFIGFVPQMNRVTGIWLGNDDNTPTRSSSVQAASLWGTYMKSLLY